MTRFPTLIRLGRARIMIASARHAAANPGTAAMRNADLALDTVHLFTFATPHAQAALFAVERALARTGAELAQLRVRPVGQIVETTLTARAPSDAAAALLADVLAGQAGVSALRLEHLRGRA